MNLLSITRIYYECSIFLKIYYLLVCLIKSAQKEQLSEKPTYQQQIDINRHLKFSNNLIRLIVRKVAFTLKK